MFVKHVMTTHPACCRPSDTIEYVAKLMLEYDCGEIPVCEDGALVGVITDRDITLRAVAEDRTPSRVAAREVMTRNVISIHENDSVDAALNLMHAELVRRLPVVNDSGKVTGIVSQADLIAKVPTLKIARVMRSLSKSTRGHVRATL